MEEPPILCVFCEKKIDENTEVVRVSCNNCPLQLACIACMERKKEHDAHHKCITCDENIHTTIPTVVTCYSYLCSREFLVSTAQQIGMWTTVTISVFIMLLGIVIAALIMTGFIILGFYEYDFITNAENQFNTITNRNYPLSTFYERQNITSNMYYEGRVDAAYDGSGGMTLFNWIFALYYLYFNFGAWLCLLSWYNAMFLFLASQALYAISPYIISNTIIIQTYKALVPHSLDFLHLEFLFFYACIAALLTYTIFLRRHLILIIIRKVTEKFLNMLAWRDEKFIRYNTALV